MLFALTLFYRRGIMSEYRSASQVGQTFDNGVEWPEVGFEKPTFLTKLILENCIF
jgi:hypothetical protein